MLIYLDEGLFKISDKLWKALPKGKEAFGSRLSRYDEPATPKVAKPAVAAVPKPTTPAPVRGPDVSSPGHQLATHEAAAGHAQHGYMMHMLNNEPEHARKMLGMYQTHTARAGILKQQGAVTTPQHHEDLAVHYHLNRDQYSGSKTPVYSRIKAHLQHAGHPPGTDINDVAEAHATKTKESAEGGYGPYSSSNNKMGTAAPYADKPIGAEEGTSVRRRVAKSLIDWDCDLIKAKVGRHIDLSKDALQRKLNGGHYSLVSAGRNIEDPEEKDLPENHPKFLARHEKLRSDLINHGLDHTEVEGHWGGKEKSFLVHHVPKAKVATPRNVMTKTFMVHHNDPSEHSTVRDLAKKYNQNSVIHSKGGYHECHYVTGADAGTHNKGAGHTLKPEATDLYTEVPHPNKTSTKFELKLDWNNKHPAKTAVLKSLTRLYINKTSLKKAFPLFIRL